MDKLSLQEFLNGEHDSLLASIDLFRTLLPHHEREASVHSGEEGRFIELALSQYLIDKLPKGIGVGGDLQLISRQNGTPNRSIFSFRTQ